MRESTAVELTNEQTKTPVMTGQGNPGVTPDLEKLLAIQDVYAADTRAFVSFIQDRALAMDVSSLRVFLEDLRGRGLAAATIRKRVLGVKHRLRLLFLQGDDALDVLKAFGFERELATIRPDSVMSHQIDPDRLVSMSEIRAMVESDLVPERTKLWIKVFSWSGLRVSELIAIRLTDCQEGHSHFTVRIHGKGKKQRKIQLPTPLILELRAFFKGLTYLFETKCGNQYRRQEVSGAIAAAGRLVLGKKISAHTLRHSFATHWILEGRSIKAVSTYLGHASTSITLDLYTHDQLAFSDLDPFAALEAAGSAGSIPAGKEP